MYHPLKFFISIGMVLFTIAFVLGARFLVYYAAGRGQGHIQSLILLAIFALMGFQSVVLGLIGDIVAANRRLLEELRLNQNRKDDAR
jgi:hypothetical protein